MIDGQPIEYAAFVAPALLAASAFNGAFYDATNIFWKLRYQKLYDAVLATPLGPRDIAVGETAFALFRGLIYAVGFFTVILALGLVQSWWALLALPATVFIGFAFAGAGIAAVTYMRSWQDFDILNLAVLPMFLFSATFFPLSTYPGWLQAVVRRSTTPYRFYAGRRPARSVPRRSSMSPTWPRSGCRCLLAGRRIAKLLLT